MFGVHKSFKGRLFVEANTLVSSGKILKLELNVLEQWGKQ